jgi:hypothetical protein
MLARMSIHARTFLFLAPFATMLAVHRVLGLSDNLLVAPEAGKPDGAMYNLIMVMVLWAGVIGFFIHTTLHAYESAAWAIAKLAFLIGLFATMVYMAGAPAA